MLLVFVIRNDKIAFGFFDGDILKGHATVGASTTKTADEYAILLQSILSFHGFQKEDFDSAIFASVAPALTETLREAVRLLFGFRAHLIGSGIKTGLTILTENPAELGGDLVASAVGALKSYTPPLILVDFGTAVTFSALDDRGAFLGCAIAPGVSISATALSASAELLPHAAPLAPKSVIGKNTAESMRCGSVFGAAAMIDGMLTRMEEQMACSATVVCSGEEAALILPFCRHATTRDDTVALVGLSEIYKRNKRKAQ
ncbi:MAG: type III pantothenate kinase [Ruminococcaceae bacterium]|nr:type III pantothenate kinase [Oscillospiraceae bacterium]